MDPGRAYLQASEPADADSEIDTSLKRRGEVTSLFLDEIPTVRYLPEFLLHSQSFRRIGGARWSRAPVFKSGRCRKNNLGLKTVSG